MKNSVLFALCFGATLVSMGCQSISSPYQGHFVSGATSLDISGSTITVTLEGKTQMLQTVAGSFDDAIKAALQGTAGLYVLPTEVSVVGIPVESPWTIRSWTSAGFYQDGMQDSKRYTDVYAVMPLDQGGPTPIDNGGIVPIPVSGGVNRFSADILYFQMDNQVQSPVSALQVQLAANGNVGAEDVELLDIVSTKMLTITPNDANGSIQKLNLLRQ